MSNKIPISIITGYLGAGKTTLLRKILKQTKRRIAILMNEFGKISIDSKVIEGKNVNMVELSGGCVCCSLIGEFEEGVKEIISKVRPDLIIVETTGVAEPDALIINVDSISEVKLDSVITVVDADGLMKFPRLGQTGLAQIENADIILLNKIDLVEKKQIEEIEKNLRSVNPRAQIYRTVKCEIDTDLLFGLELERKISEPHIHKVEEIQSFSYTSQKTFDKNKFEKFLQDLPREIYRSKGFVKLDGVSYLFNYVSGRWDLEAFDSNKVEIVFIGKNILKFQGNIIESLKKCEA
jgi:G3E family GTPase